MRTYKRTWGTEIIYSSGEVLYIEADTRQIARYRTRWHKTRAPKGLHTVSTRTVQRLSFTVQLPWKSA